jgi:hypothetical protein
MFVSNIFTFLYSYTNRAGNVMQMDAGGENSPSSPENFKE